MLLIMERPEASLIEMVKETPGRCGVCVILFLDQFHHCFLKFAAGPGTNKTELCALWLRLKSAVDKGLTKLQVLGDSKVMVDRANNQCRIANLVLQPLTIQFQEEKKKFEDIYFSHIYEEFNSLADQLSKEALLMQEGLLTEHEFMEGSQVSASERFLF
jgi:ribonuclease HI